MTNQLRVLRDEIKRHHRLIQKAKGVQKDIYLETLNNLIEKREELERLNQPVEDTTEEEETDLPL